MVSAANGAEAFYGNTTNHIRVESAEEAKRLDSITAQAWMGHHSMEIIDNSTNFENKLNRVVSSVLARLGLVDKRAGKHLTKKKFLLSDSKFEDIKFPIPYRDFYVEHRYLVSTDEAIQQRIRKRGVENSSFLYTLTTRHLLEDGAKIETRRILTDREYDVYVYILCYNLSLGTSSSM